MNEKEWRLPNKNELYKMYENLHKKGLGGFADDYYWFDVQGNIVSECKKQDEPELMKWGEYMELTK